LPRCKSQKGGKLCRAPALKDGEGFCFMHSKNPDIIEKRAAARSKAGKRTGGHNRRKIRFAPAGEAPPPPKTVEEAVAYASWATHAVAVGIIDPQVGATIQRLLREFREGKARPDIEKRIGELEKRARAAKEREPWQP
jgi:hypothetical protein